MSWIIALIALNVIVFVHELGHWLAAKLCGMTAPVFSVGMGPRKYALILGTFWGTEFRLSAIPIGGFVQIHGMGDDDEDAIVHSYSVWKRALVCVMGPLFNILFAVAIIFAVLVFHGEPDHVELTVTELTATASPEKLHLDDVIYGINGDSIGDWDEIQQLDPGAKTVLNVQRGEATLELEVVPDDQGSIGLAQVSVESVIETRSPTEALSGSWDRLSSDVSTSVTGMLRVLHIMPIPEDVDPANYEMHGVVGMVSVGGTLAAEGLLTLLSFMYMVNLGLAITNLLPIPGLDGGHLLLLGVEKIRGRPLSERAQSIIMFICLPLLFGLMGWAFWNDLVMLFRNGHSYTAFAVAAGLVLVLLLTFVELRSSKTKKEPIAAEPVDPDVKKED